MLTTLNCKALIRATKEFYVFGINQQFNGKVDLENHNQFSDFFKWSTLRALF